MASNTAPQANPAISIFVDPRDGHRYKTVTIGNLTWMAENLDFGASCNNEREEKFYSREEVQNAIPSGWRLPTSKDWKQLEQFVVSQGVSKKEIGKALKSRIEWPCDSKKGSDAFGFCGRPCGRLDEYGAIQDQCKNRIGAWWVNTDKERDLRVLSDQWTDLLHASSIEGERYSVRCVKDA